MALRWVSVDLRTGLILADLKQLTPQWPIRHSLGAYDTVTATLPLRRAPNGWTRATQEGASALIAIDSINGVDVPVWGGIVIQRNTSISAAAQLTLYTAEYYLTRRYVGDVTYTSNGQNTIVSDLVARYVLDGSSGRPGLTIRTQVDTAGAGQLRTLVYQDMNDTTLYSALQSLSSVQGGPQWCIEWEFSTPTTITPVFHVGDRIGNAQQAGLGPVVTFASANESGFGGCVTDGELLGDFGAGQGANDVMAVGQSLGSARSTSGRIVATSFDSRPTFEFRWTPDATLAAVPTLTAYAQQALAILGDGSKAITLQAALKAAPQLGRDWRLGDDIGYDVKSLAWPQRLNGVGQCIAWERTFDTIKPVLATAAIPEEVVQT